MGYELNLERADQLIQSLSDTYRVFAPKRLAKHGWKAGSDLVRYGEINSVGEIVHDQQSDFSPKDVIDPIVQTVLYFTADACVESEADKRPILLFARPCDIQGIRRLDKIFLENGGQPDIYYQRLRDKLRIVLMECREGWDTCFCVAMGANRTDQYDLAVRFEPDRLLFEVKSEDFRPLFEQDREIDFVPEFVQQNKTTVQVPSICRDQVPVIRDLPMWEVYNDRCVSCGSCNTVCITCSCFDTTDVIYNETSRDGERRRVWASCMQEKFTTMAGGHGVRKTAGERMRFKTLHKIYDYRARFGGDEQMCIGCGRCDIRCPKDISFIETINTLNVSLEELDNG